jgi:putative MFS transporter
MTEVSARVRTMAIIVAALGYFVDIYDLILFNVVRLPSLRELGVPADELLDTSTYLLGTQMLGMLVGGIVWGILGDKRGRLSVLFASILLYSLANIGNGLVQDLDTYAILRFVAGVGLAGEIGAGITLVSEVMDRRARGFGTTIVATVGICGAIAASLIGDHFHWRTAYYVGGAMGLVLLVLRIAVAESGMYKRLVDGAGLTAIKRGDLISLFTRRGRARRYLSLILVGVPIWYAVGILVAFSPEIGVALGMTEAPEPPQAVMYTYIGLAAGDLTSGLLSQHLRSRKRTFMIFLGLTALAVLAYFTVATSSRTAFYANCGFLGFATGYWAVFVTVASEQFGTNLRATATTTAPNFVRGAVWPMTMFFKWGKGELGVVESAAVLGVFVLGVAFVALRGIDETYGKDLDYVEP